MKYSTQASVRWRSTRVSLVAGLVVALLSVGAAPPAGAQTNTSLGTGALGKVTTGFNNTALGSDAMFNDTTGSGNTAAGFNALGSNNADGNTATGSDALGGNTTGTLNTAMGGGALLSNTTGNQNTAVGNSAMLGNAPPPGLSPNTGSNNTALGFDALMANINGNDNIAVGAFAMLGSCCSPGDNPNGSNNTAIGISALKANISGNDNIAVGSNALGNNTIGNDNIAVGLNAVGGVSQSFGGGSNNTALGVGALKANSFGNDNIAVGLNALGNNSGGGFNIALGDQAGANLSTGSNNIAIGADAGTNLISGNNNIEIGNLGFASDANTIRIGTKGTQTRALIAGIYNSPVFLGLPVVVNANGRLGILASSARYKRDVHGMGDASDRLMKLRPVTFRYKEDPNGTLQYGLIAEEVEHVYPELVTYGDDGKPLSVAYQMLPAMLLNEVQKQVRENRRKDAQIAAPQKQAEALQKEKNQIDGLAARLNAFERQTRTARPERLTAAMR